MIPAVSAFGFLDSFRFPFEVRTRQIVEQDVELRLEQILPALPQMPEQLLLVL